MSLNDCIGKTLKPWPILVDHYTLSPELLAEKNKVRNRLELWANTISLFCSGDFLRLEPELANLAVEKREDSQSKRLRMKVPLEKFSAVLDILESI